VLLKQPAPAIVFKDVHHVHGIGLRQLLVAFDDQQVLVVVVGGAVSEVVTSGHGHAFR
jgi:hypothetical protein